MIEEKRFLQFTCKINKDETKLDWKLVMSENFRTISDEEVSLFYECALEQFSFLFEKNLKGMEKKSKILYEQT